MRLLNISPTYYNADSVIGGGERYIEYLNEALNLSAAQSNISLETKVLSFSDTARELSNKTIIIVPGRPWDPKSISAADVKPYFIEADVVIIHQCLSSFGLYFAALARRLRKVVIGFDHGGGEHPLVRHTTEIGNLIDVAVAYSDYSANSFRDITCRVNIIRGPVNTEKFPLKDSASAETDIPTAVSVGRIMPHKGFDRIINALPKEMRLFIIGSVYDTEYADHLRSLVKEKQVLIIDKATDCEVVSYLQNADVYVHASTHTDYRGNFYAKPELLGLAPLEAMATGTQAIVSNAGSLPELSMLLGCETFQDDGDLKNRLLSISTHNIKKYNPIDIRNDVIKYFGSQQFGDKFLAIILSALK